MIRSPRRGGLSAAAALRFPPAAVRLPPAGSVLIALIALLALLALGGCATPPASPLALDWYELGNAWYDLGKWERAGAAYANAIKLDPELKAASFNMVRALAETGAYGEALATADRLLEEDPGNVRVLAAKAFVLHKQGEDEAALAIYEELLLVEPYAADAVYNAALLRAALGQGEKALTDLERLVAAKPEDTEALALFARLLADAERRDEATAAFERLVALGKADAAALERLAGLYEKAREYDKAIETLVAASGTAPGRASAWFALARLRLAEAEDGKGGLEALAKALEAGFSDRAAAAALEAEPVLAEREAVAAALAKKGLAP